MGGRFSSEGAASMAVKGYVTYLAGQLNSVADGIPLRKRAEFPQGEFPLEKALHGTLSTKKRKKKKKGGGEELGFYAQCQETKQTKQSKKQIKQSKKETKQSKKQRKEPRRWHA